jgi:hypothetical protein
MVHVYVLEYTRVPWYSSTQNRLEIQKYKHSDAEDATGMVPYQYGMVLEYHGTYMCTSGIVHSQLTNAGQHTRHDATTMSVSMLGLDTNQSLQPPERDVLG